MTAEAGPTPELAPYGIELHSHRFAAWAASRAASVKNARFTVKQGRKVLEACRFNPALSQPEMLPAPPDIDASHRFWRNGAIAAAGELKIAMTHGVAAKLINIYLKSRFVCAGHHAHARVAALHPPIDSVLLRTLADNDVGGQSKVWREAIKRRWSRLQSGEYEALIGTIRAHLAGRPMWMIEEYWKGNQ